MKIKIRETTKPLFVIVLLVLLTFLANSRVINAAGYTEDQVFKAAPPGMKLDDYFQYPGTYKGTSSTTVKNSIQLLNNGEYSSDIVKMTGAPGELASIWGKANEDGSNSNDGNYNYNYLDLTKKQTISAWMYFGYGENTDGMSFVLQNDSDGYNAIAKSITASGTTPDTGESIGVWSGGGNPTSASTLDQYAKGAIQNSIAVEFDAHTNATSITSKSNLLNNNLDGLIRNDSTVVVGQHMAWNYPGSADTYQQQSYTYYTGWLPPVQNKAYYYSMGYQQNVRNNIYITADSNDKIGQYWKHVTFNYYPPTSSDSKIAHMSIAFGDKAADGSVNSFSTWDGIGVGGGRSPVDIDLSKLNLKEGQTKIRWGITATDGSYNTENQPQAVIFQSIPAVADVLASTGLFDLTQNRDIPDLDRDSSADANVNDKDKLRFDYSLNYTSGLIETGDITAKLNLPKNVDFTPDSNGNIGQIVYNNKTVDIPSSALNSDGTAANIVLNSLSETNSSAKVQLYGTASAPDSPTATSTMINPAHTSYTSKHYIGDAMSPMFVINNEVLQISNTDDLNKTIKANESAQLSGTVSYQKGSKFDGKDLTVHTKVDGKSLDDGALSVAADAVTGKYLLSLSGSVLGSGDHKVELYLTDSKHRISNTITYNIDVEPDNSLVITPTTNTARTVTDNGSQIISGTFVHKDGTYLESGNRTISYQVTNDGRDPQDPVTTNVSGDSFSFTLNPIAAKDGISNIDNFMSDDSNYEGLILTEGKNTIDVKVTDSSGHYGTETYVINVPKISPIISSENLSPTITDISDSNLSLKYEYTDNPTYLLGKNDLIFYEQVDGSDKNVRFDNPTNSVKTPYSIDPSVSDALQGNTTAGKHTLLLYGVDPYGRKTNELSYDINVLNKYLKLDVDDYKFDTINAGSEKLGYIHRSGKWDVDVTSFKSNWSLSATGGDFVQEFNDGTPSETLNGNMVFVKGKDTQNLQNTLIATGENTGSDTPEITDVSDNWGYNDGILLDLQSFNHPGIYSSTIKWNLVESI